MKFIRYYFYVSAMVVRFITRRFIGEYDPNLEKIYSFSTIIDNEMVLFEILDAAGQLNVSKKLNEIDDTVFWLFLFVNFHRKVIAWI